MARTQSGHDFNQAGLTIMAGIGIGLIIGAILGIFIHDWAMGIGIGVAIGAAVGAVWLAFSDDMDGPTQ